MGWVLHRWDDALPHMTSLRQVEGVWLVWACFWAPPMKTDLDTLAVKGIQSLPLPALGDSHKLSSASTNRYSIKEEYLLGGERTSELWVQVISFLPQNGAIKEPLNSFGFHVDTISPHSLLWTHSVTKHA